VCKLSFNELLDRFELITRIEYKYQSKVITFYRNENNNQGMINDNTDKNFQIALDNITPYEPVILIINSRGGWVYSGWRIASSINRRTGQTCVVVPEEALSAATMITFSAKKCIMFPNAQLSPIEPQLKHGDQYVSALDLLIHEDPVKRADAERQIKLTEENLRKLCESKLSGEKLDRLVNRFLLRDQAHAAHSSSIYAEEVKRLWGEIQIQEDDDIKALHMLYKRHSFTDKDPSILIEYTRNPIPKDVRTILEKVASNEMSIDEAERLLRLPLDSSRFET
jgi:ATP-dependent protease ClpP protease subunit